MPNQDFWPFRDTNTPASPISWPRQPLSSVQLHSSSDNGCHYLKSPAYPDLCCAGTMRGRELKTFMLPQLVEARKRASVDVDAPISASHEHNLSRSSTLSNSTSPTTPSTSARCHSRLPSSNSSLTSSPVMRQSIDLQSSAKRPLTDVREEPHDREEDCEMVDGVEGRRSYEGKLEIDLP